MTTSSGIATSDTSDGAGVGTEPSPPTAGGSASAGVLDTLIGDARFAARAVDTDAAVAAFAGAGAGFSPEGLRTSIPAGCDRLDVERLGQVFGVPVAVEETAYGALRASAGYLSCTVLSADRSTVALAYVHLAPNLDGEANWAMVGTLQGARPITGLGDRAVWSDGGGGTNETNKRMLQLLVEQDGTASLIQVQRSEPQRAIQPSVGVPQLILALAVADASLTTG